MILRPEILSANRRAGEHLLVYTSGEANQTLVETLAQTGIECRIYGVRRDLTTEVVEGKLRFRPFSETEFIDDLASCRAVIAGAGFTLMGEAVYLHKPMLALPLARQFEQVLNARYLELEGFGRSAANLDDPKIVDDFIGTIPHYERNLEGYVQSGNTEIFDALDGFLDKAAAGVI